MKNIILLKDPNNTNLLKQLLYIHQTHIKLEIDRDTIKENDISQNLSLLEIISVFWYRRWLLIWENRNIIILLQKYFK